MKKSAERRYKVLGYCFGATLAFGRQIIHVTIPVETGQCFKIRRRLDFRRLRFQRDCLPAEGFVVDFEKTFVVEHFGARVTRETGNVPGLVQSCQHFLD